MLDARASELGAQLGVDGPTFLRERAEILGVAPAGTVSAGGTCRLLRAGDGRWVAINLARHDDIGLLAAWMGHEWHGPVWDAVGDSLSSMDAASAVERAQLLAIPAAVAEPPGVPAGRTGHVGARSRGTRDLVVDLSSLWAGPLCARLLGARGARVVKVEHAGRPDGARAGPPAFWDRLNREKEEITLDFGAPEGRAALERLLDRATTVITSARPRAIEQLGLDLDRRFRDDGIVWVAITGYGYEGPNRDRVAFGDDAAVAAGLAVAAGGPDAPVFVGDAPADPLAGLRAATLATHHLERGEAAFVDVALVDAVAEALTGSQYARRSRQEVA